MIKNRLSALEKRIARRGIGSQSDYLQAVKRVMACTRAKIEYILHGREEPEPAPADQQDTELIRQYEAANGITAAPGAKERIERKLQVMHDHILWQGSRPT